VPKWVYEKPVKIDINFREAVERFAQTDPKEVEQEMDEGAELQPLSLIEDAETGDRFVLYALPNGYKLELRFDGDEPWATRKQIADLFGRSVQRIGIHINNILEEGELPTEGNVRKAYIAGSDKPVETYSLDMVLSVGYRVKASKQAIIFRRWANSILKQYLLKGFVIDSPRLKDPKRNDRLSELLEEIADIRASEANVWQRALELVSKCSDYHAMTDKDKADYFATFQNTVHWAVTSHTAAEIIYERSDAARPYAGLTTFDGIEEGRDPRPDHMKVAKNYYGHDEISRLRMITNLALDFLASQAEQGRLVMVAQYTAKLRELVDLDGRPLIKSGYNGSRKKTDADKKAVTELAVYKERLRLEKEANGMVAMEALMQQARLLADEKKQSRKKK